MLTVTDRKPDVETGAAFTLRVPGARRSAFARGLATIISFANAKSCAFNVQTQQLKMIGGVLCHTSGKQDCELFAADAESLTAPTHPRQPRGDQAQHLISGIVTVCVIDALEMINVHHRDRKRMFKPNQGVIEGAAGIQTREFVLVRERVGILDDAAGEDESGDSEVCVPVRPAAPYSSPKPAARSDQSIPLSMGLCSSINR